MGVPRILLVEPNDHLRRVFRRRFAREGFELVEAVDGDGAMGAARTHHLDLIVVEGAVRDAGGTELPALIAGDPELGKVPLIVLAVRSHGEADAPQGYRASGAGAVDAAARPGWEPGGRAAAGAGEPADGSCGGSPNELMHPFRPGRLVEMARGALQAALASREPRV